VPVGNYQSGDPLPSRQSTVWRHEIGVADQGRRGARARRCWWPPRRGGDRRTATAGHRGRAGPPYPMAGQPRRITRSRGHQAERLRRATTTHHRLPTRLWSGGQPATAVTATGAHIRASSESPSPPKNRRSLRRHRVLSTERIDLSPTARDFLHASIRHDHFRRRRATTVLSVMLILALTAAGVAIIAQGRTQERRLAAETQRRIATASQLVAQVDSARNKDPRTALQLEISARPSRE
jgi:hypothetical protein